MNREDLIDGLHVIARRRGMKIQQGDVEIVEAAIKALAKPAPTPRAEVVAPQRYDLYIDQGPGGHDYIEEMAAPKGDWVRWKDISSSYMNNGEGEGK